MNFPLYIARRYLFAKKSHNAINIITMISVVGVMVGATALVVVLSVFNGFDGLIQTLFSTFDPELKITPAKGKVFTVNDEKIQKLYSWPGIKIVGETLEENALIKYEDKQYPGVIKGVSDNFHLITGVDSMMVKGKFILRDGNIPFAVIGQGLAYYLSYSPGFAEPLSIYVIKRTGGLSMDVTKAVKQKMLHASGVFSIEQSYDLKYLIIPLKTARELLEYDSEVTALELKLEDDADVDEIGEALSDFLGEEYLVKDRYQQNEAFYKIMKTEKWAIFFILLFILIIASFNVIGSLSMLVIDKKEDIQTLQSMGASQKLIRKIFLVEGWMISFFGVTAGILLGVLICWLQMEFGLVKLKGSGSFIIDAYPVILKFTDLIIIFLAVNFIGFLASVFPVRFMSKKYKL